ncbi:MULTISPECIES: helix-turn-helix domain-containing protein [Winogradskyella]|uniref:helix-turn-helix domain-containing protein n=1 Tax=Winogradskyella TaxID=286104 RepID=UPI0015CDDC20|nr:MULTISPECIES: helix-turn-helix transcriptional regulator [Winogradskyella]QXP79159.1 helix-turn-helix transcriptional regulator [Winogradskyella sp. HaHa_3_26]
MINSTEFTKRLQKVIDFYNESASGFAEKIGVQRSSISHILSGRNKPSLDFVMKILHAYPEVELYWLLNGKGNFPNNPNTPELPGLKISEPTKPINQEIVEKQQTVKPDSVSVPSSESDSEIEKIVIFYKNGTFKSYNP